MLGPIFVRELLTLPRRTNHYVARTVYLGVLWILALTAWQTLVGWERSATLGDQARFSLLLFQVFTYLILVLLLFFAALSAANSITTEKDRRTFVLLLMTDLHNYEIVVGKMLGSLLQMLLLLAATMPILALLLFMGGVAGEQVIEAMVVLAGTALAAGSLGTLIALWRDKTFQTLALTVLCLVLYLCAVRVLTVVPDTMRALFGRGFAPAGETVELWQQWLDPFLALQTVLEPPAQMNNTLSAAYAFGLAMTVISVLLIGWAIWKLRVWNPSGEPIIHREVVGETEAEALEKRNVSIHAAPGKIRNVWANPILWREMVTRGYGKRPMLVKAAYFLVLAIICYYHLVPLFQGEVLPDWAAANALAPVVILSLLLVTAQAVTAITSERDNGALNLLLVTDLSANEFIFGKLGGICYNCKEFLLPPIILAFIYGAYGYLAFPPELSRNMEAMACLIATILVLLGFSIVMGIHVSLRTEKSRFAIVNALGTVFFLSVGTLICIYLILINGEFEYQWASFIFFLAAGIGGLWWVLSGNRPSAALTLASWACPIAVFYSITNVLIGRPGTRESADPLIPFLVTNLAFVFTIAAMLVPLLSEFDVAMGRTTGEAD